MHDLDDWLLAMGAMTSDDLARWNRLIRDLDRRDHPTGRTRPMRPNRIVFAHSARPWRGRFRREWWFKIVAANGKVLCHSEGYARRGDCVHAARLICENGVVIDNPPPPDA